MHLQYSRLLFSAVMAVALTLAVNTGDGQTRKQPAADAPPRFEVASIKLSRNPEPGGNVEITPGRFKGTDLALQWLILTAYRIKSSNLSGNLPDWTISERYSIDAKTDDASGENRILSALQTLLIDRFHLKEHREMKEEPVYFLTIAKGGVKMPAGSCVPVKKDLPNECYSVRSEGLVQTLDWRGVTMSDPSGVAYRSLAWALSGPLRRTVIDKTGLTGTFDVHLRWSRDPEPAAVGQQVEPADPSAPAISEAVEKQLGLRLESGRGPVEYLVVDHVERPSEN
ncbi:MAG TPA: TIGR03435 family protein [Bryobacteraceae bacterium]|jgi:uncharacterized protein (TIGR03435 family)|nr:TIGR03435 family protein [Bryobacteraceae bacterium]